MNTVQQTLGRLSWAPAVVALIISFTVSGNLLTDLGSAYVSDGGTLLEKVHPASYLMISAGTIRLSGDLMRRATKSNMYGRRRKLVIYIAGILFCALYCLLFSGTGGIIALLDTYLPAGCAALALSDATQEQRDGLRSLIVLLCAANAAIAIAEAWLQTSLVPIQLGPLDKGSEFRPTALYDHPLTGAAATALGLLLTAQLNWRRTIILSCQAVLLVGLVCFGERAPLGIGLGLLIFVASLNMGLRIIHRIPCSRRVATLAWTAFVAAFVIALVFADGLSERLAAHSYWDDSAQVRLSQFRILAWLTPVQLVFGCPREDLIALLEPLRLTHGVGVLENFWLVMLTSLGLLCFPIFILTLLQLLRWLCCVGGRSGRLMVVMLIATASTSNSLGRKSPLLTMLVACVVASGVHSDFHAEGGLHASNQRSHV